MRASLLLGMALLLGGGATGAVVSLTPGCHAQADPFLEEMGELNARFAHEWDRERGQYPEGPARDSARAEWRKRYEAEAREVRAKYDR